MELLRVSALNTMERYIVGLMVVVIVLMAFNSYQLYQVKSDYNEGVWISALASTNSASGASGIIPAGVPAIYGEELGVSFDDVTADNPQAADLAIRKLAVLDQQIELSGKDKERYINILYKKENGISCEYCCGARAIIFENGASACGCAHSYAMRGLTKYLITEHGSEYTDDQLLEEAGKWKTLFFPTQIQQKADILKSQGIELSYTNLASNKYRGIEQGKGSAGGMVGGC